MIGSHKQQTCVFLRCNNDGVFSTAHDVIIISYLYWQDYSILFLQSISLLIKLKLLKFISRFFKNQFLHISSKLKISLFKTSYNKSQ